MIELKKLSPAALKAAMQGGTAGWGQWGSIAHHALYVEPIKSRRKCLCGCGKRVTHAAKANGIAMASGCEWSMRWFAVHKTFPPQQERQGK